MSRLPAFALRSALPLAAAAAALIGVLPGVHAQKPAPVGKAVAADAKPTRYYVGVSDCVFCHEQGRAQRGGPPLVCLCREADTWLCKDKHQDAFNVLDPDKNPRAKRMAEILGYDPRQKPECLSCHSTPGVNVPAAKRTDPPYSESFAMSDGVGCISCHGAYEEWMDAHGGVHRASWRKQSRKVKEDVYGMTDLWDPARRVEVCGSCHVGSRAENKVVTHLMYAAGHPPLPSFEVGAFCDRMPRHWQLMAEKGKEARELLGAKPGELEQTKLVVVGAAASFKQAMTLLAADAEAAAKEDGAVDFAQMDCAACHHDLKQPSWRQARGYAGRPGRPGMRDWPLALLPITFPLAGEDPKSNADFEEKLKALYKAFDDRPYGDPQEVEAAAEDLAKWADQLGGRLNAKTVAYDRRAALGVLRRLAALPAERAPDYDTARQIGWAFRVVYGEVYREFQKAKDDEGVKTFATLEKTKDEVKASLDALARTLDLDLSPADNEVAVAALPDDDAARKKKLTEYADARQMLYNAYVPDVLNKTRDYKPDEFQKAFAEMAKLLPASPSGPRP